MSFSDMMSSGRGPGVIGMVMALVVLLGFGVLFMFAFDEGFQGGELSVEAAIIQQGKDIANYQMGLDNAQKSLEKSPQRLADAKELVRLNRENQALQQNIVSLTEKKKAGEAEIVDKTTVFNTYKDEYRAHVRGQAKGEKIPQLTSLSGNIYNNVDIREVTAIGIQIRHDEGLTRIPFEELPEAMKDYYQFDPNQKVEAKIVEDKARLDHEKAVAVSDAQAAVEMAKQQVLDAADAKAKKKRDIATKESQVIAIKNDIRTLQNQRDQEKAKAAAARGSGRTVIVKAGMYDGQIRNRQADLANVQAELVQLRSSL